MTEVEPHSSTTFLDDMPATDVLDLFPVPILALDRDGVIVYVNPSFANLVGYRSEELIDTPAASLLTDSQSSDAGIDCLRGRSRNRIDLRHRDEWTVHAVASASALMRDDDPVSLVAVYDLTDQLWARSSCEAPPHWSDAITARRA